MTTMMQLNKTLSARKLEARKRIWKYCIKKTKSKSSTRCVRQVFAPEECTTTTTHLRGGEGWREREREREREKERE